MVAYSFYESDSRIIQYAHALIRRGDTVDVIALAHPGTSPVEVIDGVTVYRIQRREINERVAVVYLFRILRFLFAAMAVLFWKHLRRPYQLVHVHSVPDFLVFSAFPLRLMGVPVILDVHDILPEFYASKFKVGENSFIYRALLKAERIAAMAASHVIVANQLWHERLITRSVSRKKCSVVCNYPNSAIFYSRPKQNHVERFLLMYPGSLNWHQGVDIAVRAFALVTSKIPTAQFHIYGEGPARVELERLVAELGLDRSVTIQDYRPTEEIATLMAAADLAVVPKRASSKFGTEAASTKIQEFMALDVPVLVSRTKIDTFYFNDNLVRFFESENVAALSEAILDLYTHPEERRKLVESARRHIDKNNWQLKQNEYLGVVNDLTRFKPRRETAAAVSDQRA